MILVTPKPISYADGYAANPRGYVSYAVTRPFPSPHVRRRARGNCTFSRERYKTTCNRVTHVTTGLSGVTVRVTNAFSRNHKGFDMSEMSREEKRVWVNENMPTCAAVAASFREVFGDVRMVYASENGHVLGTPGPEGVKLSETGIGPMALPKRGK